jgi:hypothetical protein
MSLVDAIKLLLALIGRRVSPQVVKVDLFVLDEGAVWTVLPLLISLMIKGPGGHDEPLNKSLLIIYN